MKNSFYLLLFVVIIIFDFFLKNKTYFAPWEILRSTEEIMNGDGCIEYQRDDK